MEENTLGNKIRNRRLSAPFSDMSIQQKRPISSIICKDCRKIEEYHIYLISCIITESKVDTHMEMEEYINKDGIKDHRDVQVPNKCAILRYKKIVDKFLTEENNKPVIKYIFEKEKFSDGRDSNIDAEYYSYTGSSVLIDQIENEITEDMLPAPTTIAECSNQMNKKFLKFL